MENNQSGNVMKVLSYVAEQTMALAKENKVLGEPVEKDGVTVIPVSKLSVGFAGGGADVVDANRKKSKYPAGGGAKVALTPMSFLVIAEGNVHTINVEAPEGSTAMSLIDTVIETVKGFIQKKKAEK